MLANVRPSYYVTLRSDAYLNYFPHNAPSRFANMLREPLVVEPPLDYEVALCELHVDGLRVTTDQLLAVKCSIAVRRQIGEQVDTFLGLVRLKAPPLRPNPARMNPADDVSYADVPRFVATPSSQSYVFARPQYSPLTPMQNAIVDEITVELAPPLEADAVVVTLHVRRRKDVAASKNLVRAPAYV